ncbi:MAG: ABC transporter permease subunit [Clostridiales bacterium]|nr:ABC transporter permease subunit [Clostridiales bacterium]
MLSLLKAEFHKLKTSKIFWLMVLAGVAQGIAGPILSYILRTKSGEDMLLFSIQIQQFLVYMPILAIFAYFISSEFHTGSIKNLVTYGHRRRNIIIAKSIAFYVGTVIISFAFPLVIALINTVINGYGRSFDLQALLLILRVTFLMTLIYISMASIIVMLCFLTKNAVAPSVIFYLFDTVCRVGQALSMKNNTVKAIYGKTVFYQLNTATLRNINFSQGLEVVAICLITITLSTIIAMAAFNKAELK